MGPTGHSEASAANIQCVTTLKNEKLLTQINFMTIPTKARHLLRCPIRRKCRLIVTNNATLREDIVSGATAQRSPGLPHS
jgi:hypothetical protein